MLYPRYTRATGYGGDFDQKQKFGVKLPNPWIRFQFKVPHLGEGFEFKVSHQTENLKAIGNKEYMLPFDKTFSLIGLLLQ